jgi:hypothetical protein
VEHSERDQRGERLGRLAGLAHALQVGGIYNGGKLVRAILDRELVRLGVLNAPAGNEAAAEALDRLAGESEAAGESAALVAALRAAADAAGRNTTLPLAAAPPVHVCRVCGELFLGELPARCSACDAPASTFREHLPTWFLEPIASAHVLAALEAGPSHLARILGDRSDSKLARSPRAGEWSVRDTLEHLATAEQLLAARLPLLLTEDDPELVATAAWAETSPSDESTAPTGAGARELLARFTGLRVGVVAILRDLDAPAWERPGRHPEWGSVTVRSQAAYFARHEASHVAQIAAAAAGRVPGERAPGEQAPGG